MKGTERLRGTVQRLPVSPRPDPLPGPGGPTVPYACTGWAVSTWLWIHRQNRVNVDPDGISFTVARIWAVVNDTEPPIIPRDCWNDVIDG